MPLVEGDTLRARMARHPRLSLEETIRITRALAAALDYAHGTGVIHRDLKPENVLFQAGEPILADFGIALAVAAAGTRLTETGLSLGTPRYMSPEQAAGDRTIDARSDVYSLGCLVYEMLSGRSPHEGPTVAAILVRVLTETPAPLGGLVPGLPPPIEAAVTRALARSPADRFATAGAFAAALGIAPVPVELSDKSIVVLPFDNMSPDPNDAWLSDGLTEELISDLSRIRAFRVISRNSAIAVKQRTRDVREIARLVDVRYVLEGSVRRAGDSLRITAQLIDGASDTHLWTEKYSGTMTDVFAMQESVSRAIVAALEVVLTPDESRRLQQHSIPDVAAYECYLRARQLIYTFSAEPLDRALALLDESEKAAGSSALLLACRGWIHCSRYNNRPSATNPGLKIGLALAERACAEDPSCALAFFVVGWGKMVGPIGFPAAIPAFRRAIELDPGQTDALAWLSFVLAFCGEDAEAERTVQQAVRLDPLGSMPAVGASAISYFQGEFEEAERRLLAPGRSLKEDFLIAVGLGLFVLAPQGRVAELGAILDHWREALSGEYCLRVPSLSPRGSRWRPRHDGPPVARGGRVVW